MESAIVVQKAFDWNVWILKKADYVELVCHESAFSVVPSVMLLQEES